MLVLELFFTVLPEFFMHLRYCPLELLTLKGIKYKHEIFYLRIIFSFVVINLKYYQKLTSRIKFDEVVLVLVRLRRSFD